METTETKNTGELVKAMQAATLALLNDMVAHKVKGADILLNAEVATFNFVTEKARWVEELKDLLIALQPFFGIVRDWIKEEYNHLLVILDWCKDKWHELFG